MPRVEQPMSKSEWIKSGRRKNNGELVKAPEFKPCPVVGCNKQMKTCSNQMMCGDCRNALKKWHRGTQSSPPPVVLQEDGKWYRNTAVAV